MANDLANDSVNSQSNSFTDFHLIQFISNAMQHKISNQQQWQYSSIVNTVLLCVLLPLNLEGCYGKFNFVFEHFEVPELVL